MKSLDDDLEAQIMRMLLETNKDSLKMGSNSNAEADAPFKLRLKKNGVDWTAVSSDRPLPQSSNLNSPQDNGANCGDPNHPAQQSRRQPLSYQHVQFQRVTQVAGPQIRAQSPVSGRPMYPTSNVYPSQRILLNSPSFQRISHPLTYQQNQLIHQQQQQQQQLQLQQPPLQIPRPPHLSMTSPLQTQNQPSVPLRRPSTSSLPPPLQQLSRPQLPRQRGPLDDISLSGPSLYYFQDRGDIVKEMYSACNLVPSFSVFVREFLENGGKELLNSRESTKPWCKYSGFTEPMSSSPKTDALANKKFIFPKQNEFSKKKSDCKKKAKVPEQKIKEWINLCLARKCVVKLMNCGEILDRLSGDNTFSIAEFEELKKNFKRTSSPSGKSSKKLCLSMSKPSPKRTTTVAIMKSPTGVKPASEITGPRPGPLSMRAVKNVPNPISPSSVPSPATQSTESRVSAISYAIGGSVTISPVTFTVPMPKDQSEKTEASRSPPEETSEKPAPSATAISSLASRLPHQQISVTTVPEPASPTTPSATSGAKSSTSTRPGLTSSIKVKPVSDSVTINKPFAVKRTTSPFKTSSSIDHYRSGDASVRYKSSAKPKTSPKHLSPRQTEIIRVSDKRPSSADREHKKLKPDIAEKPLKSDIDKSKHPEVTITPRLIPAVAEVQDSRIDSSGWKSPGSAPSESPASKTAGERSGDSSVNSSLSALSNDNQSIQVPPSEGYDSIQTDVLSTIIDPRRIPTILSSSPALKLIANQLDELIVEESIGESSFVIDLKNFTCFPILKEVNFENYYCCVRCSVPTRFNSIDAWRAQAKKECGVKTE